MKLGNICEYDSSTGLFWQVLAAQMKHYTESREIDKISRLQGEVSDVKDILVQNIGKPDWCACELYPTYYTLMLRNYIY